MFKLVKKLITRTKATKTKDVPELVTRPVQKEETEEKPEFIIEGIYNPIEWLNHRDIFDKFPKTKKNMVVKKLLSSDIMTELVGLIFFEVSGPQDALEHVLYMGGVREASMAENNIFIYVDCDTHGKIYGVASQSRVVDYIKSITNGVKEKAEDHFFNTMCLKMFNSRCGSPINRIEKYLNKYFSLVDNNGLLLMMGISIDDAIFKDNGEKFFILDDPYKIIVTIAYHDDGFMGATNRITNVIELGDGYHIGHISYYNLSLMREELSDNGSDTKYVDNIYKFVGTLL